MSLGPQLLDALATKYPDYEILLLGSKQDLIYEKKLLGHELLKKHKKTLVSYIGKKSIPELKDLFLKARLIICHDSMAGHLASYFQTPSLTLSLGTVRPCETTPYGEGHFSLASDLDCFPCYPKTKCEQYPCQTNLLPNKVFSVIESLLMGDLEQNGPASFSHSQKGQTLYKSFRDQLSGLQLLSQDFQEAPNFPDIWRAFYAVLWPYILEEQEVALQITSLRVQDLEKLKTYQYGLEKLYQINLYGVQFTKILGQYFQDPHKYSEKIISTLKDIESVEKMFPKIRKSYPFLAPIIDFYFVERSNRADKNPFVFWKNQSHSYEEAGISVKILYDLIEQTLKKFHKIMDTNRTFDN